MGVALAAVVLLAHSGSNSIGAEATSTKTYLDEDLDDDKDDNNRSLGSILRLIANKAVHWFAKPHAADAGSYYLHHHRATGLHHTTSGLSRGLEGHAVDFDQFLEDHKSEPGVMAHIKQFETFRDQLQALATEYRALSEEALELVSLERADTERMQSALVGMNEAYMRGDRKGVAGHIGETMKQLRLTRDRIDSIVEEHGDIVVSTEQLQAKLDAEIVALDAEASMADAQRDRKGAASLGMVVATEVLANALAAAGPVVQVGERLLGYATSAALLKGGEHDAARAVALSTIKHALVEDFREGVSEVITRLHEVEGKYEDVLAMLLHTYHVLRDADDEVGSHEDFDSEVFASAQVAAEYLKTAYFRYVSFVKDLEADSSGRVAGGGDARLPGPDYMPEGDEGDAEL